jgi:hypothetical protein
MSAAPGDMFPETHNAVPEGTTPSWFTDLGWFLTLERRLLKEGAIPRPFDLDPFAHPNAPVAQLIKGRGGDFIEPDPGAWTWDPAMRWHIHGGLREPWADRIVWANPPYDAETIEMACWKMRREADNAATVVALLPAWTDRAWWHEYIEPARKSGRCVVEFLKGRLTFGWPENPVHMGADSAKFANCVVRWPRA